MTRKSYREHQSANDYTKVFSGLLLLSFGLGRKLGRLGATVVTVIGASRIAEGMTGYSPVAELWRNPGLKKAGEKVTSSIQGLIPVPSRFAKEREKVAGRDRDHENVGNNDQHSYGNQPSYGDERVYREDPETAVSRSPGMLNDDR